MSKRKHKRKRNRDIPEELEYVWECPDCRASAISELKRQRLPFRVQGTSIFSHSLAVFEIMQEHFID